MTSIQKRISDIEYLISMIEFQDHLSSDDYKRLDSLEKELQELKSQLVPSGYYVVLKFDWSTDPVYFTGDRILTCGSEPTYFESEEEAIESIKASTVSTTPYEIRKAGE